MPVLFFTSLPVTHIMRIFVQYTFAVLALTYYGGQV
jgi:hypothetical protein